MNDRILGKDLTVSAVGLGCMGMSHAYGAPSDKREMVLTAGRKLVKHPPSWGKILLRTGAVLVSLRGIHRRRGGPDLSRPDSKHRHSCFLRRGRQPLRCDDQDRQLYVGMIA